MNVPTEEEVLKEALAAMHRSYQKASEPIIKRLVEIEAMKPPKPFVLDGVLYFYKPDATAAPSVPTDN